MNRWTLLAVFFLVITDVSGAFASGTAFNWYDAVKNIDERDCNLYNRQVQRAVRNAENVAENNARTAGYPLCQRLNPTYYYRGRQRECVVQVSLMCDRDTQQCPGSSKTAFNWYDSAKNIDERDCNLRNPTVRMVIQNAENVAQNNAIRAGYPYCEPLTPTYYYRGRQRECVVSVGAMCARQPGC